MTIIRKIAAGVAAAALATTAHAQASGTPAAGQPGAQGQQATEKQREHFKFLHELNANSANFAKQAAERATAPSVKSLASRIASDHERYQKELERLAQARGIQLGTPSLQSSQAQVDRLKSIQGAEYDAQVADLLAKDRESRVAHLKTVRDETPGKDAELKSWMDTMENSMEEHRNLARASRSETQRQGRTPPKP